MDVMMERNTSEFTPTFSRNAVSFSGSIDDSSILSTSTWSSQKISQEIAGISIPVAATAGEIAAIISGYSAT